MSHRLEISCSGKMPDLETSFFAGKRVVVTGGTGFVGSHFVRQLKGLAAKIIVPIHLKPPKYWEPDGVELVKADLLDQNACRAVFSEGDVVVHAAGAVSAAGVTTGSNPMSAITANLSLTANVLEAAWAKKVDRILIFGSSTGYPVTDHPVKEEEMWMEEPHPSYFGYGWMRRYLEKMAEYVYRKGGVKVALIRPTATYGPYDDFDPVTGHVVPALIRRAVNRETPFEVWGTGEEVRDFLYIEDLVRGCLLALERHAECQPINIGFGETITIREMVDAVLSATNFSDAEVKCRPDKPVTIPKRMVDCSNASLYLNFKPTVSLREGIQRTVDFFRSI
jgi:GDP-L-fucose synthase